MGRLIGIALQLVTIFSGFLYDTLLCPSQAAAAAVGSSQWLLGQIWRTVGIDQSLIIDQLIIS